MIKQDEMAISLRHLLLLKALYYLQLSLSTFLLQQIWFRIVWE